MEIYSPTELKNEQALYNQLLVIAAKLHRHDKQIELLMKRLTNMELVLKNL